MTKNFYAPSHLPGGLAWFIPCQPSAHHARLSHLGWRHIGRFLISLIIIRWLVPVLDPVFIFRIVILFSNVQRNDFASQERAQLSGVLVFLLGIFQRLNDGKSKYLRVLGF